MRNSKHVCQNDKINLHDNFTIRRQSCFEKHSKQLNEKDFRAYLGKLALFDSMHLVHASLIATSMRKRDSAWDCTIN